MRRGPDRRNLRDLRANPIVSNLGTACPLRSHSARPDIVAQTRTSKQYRGDLRVLYGRKFNLLFVCHANLCRSPMAEHLARHSLYQSFGADGVAVSVTSAGTHADAGSPIHPGSAQVLAERGIDIGRWTSRPLTAGMLDAADLVLVAGRPQRAACVTLAPRALRRTFTVRQFSRIARALPQSAPTLGGSPDARFRGLVEHVARWRSQVAQVAAREDEIADPVRQPIEAFRACAAAIEKELCTILSAAARL
jgi:protein-tyrosine phosphatase